jgi:hypothetical protein
MTQFPDLDTLIYYVTERERIRLKKERGDPWPWTDDPILRDKKFCNVHREDDRGTRWIADHWRTPHADDPDLWFAMVVARNVNRIESLTEIGYPVPWDPDHFVEVMTRRLARTEAYGSAYVITTSTGYRLGQNMATFQCEKVFGPLWQSEWTRRRLRPRPRQSLSEYAGYLRKEWGFKGFMTGQVIADLKHVGPLRGAVDWYDWAVSGPGSRRGMSRLLSRPLQERSGGKIDARWNEYDWLTALRALQTEIARRGIDLAAQDLEHCLCEYDKLLRARADTGRDLRPYVPTIVDDEHLLAAE